MEDAFKRWWAAREAEGYQYGRGPLATVKFGFEAGYASALTRVSQPQAGERIKELEDALGSMVAAFDGDVPRQDRRNE